MEPVPTVSVFDISSPGPRDHVLAEWRGFVEFQSAEATAPGPPLLVLGHPQAPGWQWFAGLGPQPIRPIGCHFLRDIEIGGVGYPFWQGRYIREFSHTSDVGLQWLENDDQPENPRNAPAASTVNIAEPVLFVFGPGFPIFGHWLLDFLPRVAIAQRVLGKLFDQLVIPLPDDTPDWVTDMLHFYCAVPAAQVRTFSRMTERLMCSRVCLPSFAHDGHYALHSFMRDFYGSFRSSKPPRIKRRICLSRRNFERSTRGVWRIFENREAFERMAIGHGYEVVMPEELSFAAQIELFQSAECIIGEQGSGMHAAIFADPGTLVATFPSWNGIQLRIGAAFGHRNVSVMRAIPQQEPNGPLRYTVPEADLAGLFIVLNMLRPLGASPTAVAVPARP